MFRVLGVSMGLETSRFPTTLPFSSSAHAALFPQLADTIYADWTGAAVSPAPLVREHSEFLLTRHLGNPHSHHASSALAQDMDYQARGVVLHYFNADPDEYDVIWT